VWQKYVETDPQIELPTRPPAIGETDGPCPGQDDKTRDNCREPSYETLLERHTNEGHVST
jgi:hypothetical protein